MSESVNPDPPRETPEEDDPGPFAFKCNVFITLPLPHPEQDIYDPMTRTLRRELMDTFPKAVLKHLQLHAPKGNYAFAWPIQTTWCTYGPTERDSAGKPVYWRNRTQPFTTVTVGVKILILNTPESVDAFDQLLSQDKQRMELKWHEDVPYDILNVRWLNRVMETTWQVSGSSSYLLSNEQISQAISERITSPIEVKRTNEEVGNMPKILITLRTTQQVANQKFSVQVRKELLSFYLSEYKQPSTLESISKDENSYLAKLTAPKSTGLHISQLYPKPGSPAQENLDHRNRVDKRPRATTTTSYEVETMQLEHTRNDQA